MLETGIFRYSLLYNFDEPTSFSKKSSFPRYIGIYLWKVVSGRKICDVRNPFCSGNWSRLEFCLPDEEPTLIF